MRKNIRYYLALLPLTILGCIEPEDLMTEDAKTGGLLDASSTALNYVVGNAGPYEMEFLVKQGGGDNPITEIRLYKSFAGIQTFTRIEDGEEVEVDTVLYSNEVLDRTLEVTDDGNHFLTTEYMFDELIADLEISSWDDETPEPLSDSDGDYTIGDQWIFRIEVELADGRTIQQAYTVNVTVSTRFAGKYKVVDAIYYRIGVVTAEDNDFGDGGQMTIASVDAITYQQVDYWGGFSGNTLFFQIDPTDLEISYPAEWDGTAQTGNGQPLITCALNPADMTNVNCGDTNYATQDDVAGKDRLTMSYGYYTAGSGPREFYQVLEKIVE